ncbi:MAG: hypothetical protein EAZ15_00355 [Sphingobacteriales bacterium]|nr:MAG: hypothetical protein EAZ15_00355 [Sphingobacteriales bacterium]
MKNQYLALLLMPVIMASSCENEAIEKENPIDDGIVCTMEAKAGLNVSVSLQNSSNLEQIGITVTAKDGLYTENLVAYPPHQLNFTGAFERKGNYIITVSKTGYKTYTSGVINVIADRCHVIPQIVNVVLEVE